MAAAERRGRRLIPAAVIACIAGCAADEALGHQCRVIPTGMVECVPVGPAEGERPR